MTVLVTKHLPLVAGAPDGIKKLRALILELAVRGRLLPTARQPNSVPVGWLQAKLGSILSFEYGDNLPAAKRSNTGEYPVYGSNGVVGTHNVSFVQHPCIVIGRKGSAGALNLCTSPGCCVTDVAYYCVPPQSMSLEYTFKLLHTLGLDNLGKGIKPGLNRNEAYALDVLIPPLPEQRRIVAKVDELMALCDRLEADQADAEAAHAQLVQALLDSLTQATDAADFRASWQRLSEHFHTLFTTEASIDALKQTVLQLAVMGKLTSQSDDGGNARTTYERVIPLPHGYQRQGKQKVTGSSLIDAALLPILPASWCYLTVDDLYAANHIVDYADGNHGSDYPSKAEFGKDGVLFLTAAQISDIGKIDWGNCPRLSNEKAELLTKGWATGGDVLVTHNATVGRTAIVEGCPDARFLLGTSVTFYRLNGGSISNLYLYIYFSSPSWYSQMAAVMRQTTRNQVSITKQALFYIALPPRQEQDLIANVVAELLTLCDQLKAGLAESRQFHAQLATALVEQAVA